MIPKIFSIVFLLVLAIALIYLWANVDNALLDAFIYLYLGVAILVIMLYIFEPNKPKKGNYKDLFKD